MLKLTRFAFLTLIAVTLLLSGCGEQSKTSDFLKSRPEDDIFTEKPLQSSYSANDNGRKVIEVWKDTIEKHDFSKENIVLMESLLSELAADSIILSKNDQIRMNRSLDRYLQQFGGYFEERKTAKSKPKPNKADLKKNKNPSEGHCYWLAWLISRGAKEKKLTKEQIKTIRDSYESTVNDAISSLEKYLYSGLESKDKKKYSPYINKGNAWLKKTFDAYYRELHDDFLFPGFDKPIGKEVKERAIRGVLTFDVPRPPVGSEREMLVLKEEVYLKELEFWMADAPKTLLWHINYKALLLVGLKKTEKWGHMSYEGVTRNDGAWPFLFQFKPIEAANKDERIGRWKVK